MPTATTRRARARIHPGAWLPTVLLALAACAPMPAGNLPPAALPDRSEVAAAGPSAIDGIWTISTIGKRIRIEGGRAWALDPWVHMFSAEIRPGMVVLRNLQAASPGHYEGEDLPLSGRWQATLQEGAIDVEVATGLGSVAYKLLPVELDDAAWYRNEVARAAPPPVAIAPTPQPPPRRRPSARGCGGEGEQPCEIIGAKFEGKARKLGCPGRQSYFSTLQGGSCWVCPDGYMRASPTRRMDHPKACRKRGSLLGPWTRARFQKRAWGCPKGQFHMAKGGGSCMSCPRGYKRLHVAGADSGKCKPDERCEAGLRIAKQPPEKNALANLLGLMKAKVCAPPFDIRAAARRDIKGYGFMQQVMKNLAEELVADVRQRKSHNLKRLLKAKNWREAYRYLRQLPAFRAFLKTAREAGNRSISIGFAGDVQLLVGGNGEVGLAIDLVERKVKPYESAGLSKGLAVGIESSIALGVWKGPFESGYAQGFSTSVSAAVSIGGAVWYSYYHPQQGQERLLGMTMSAGIGAGVEFGEYNEVGTWLLSEVFAQD